MQVSLTIIKYPTRFVPIAFFAMVIHRFFLWRNKSIHFYKLMGTGKNGTFDKQPDWHQWGILAAHQTNTTLDYTATLQQLYGTFIATWLQKCNCTTITYILQPIEGHGTWDGKKPFGNLQPKSDYEGTIAVLTRATIRLNKLKYFWQHVAPIAAKMNTAPGFIKSYGVGELPWIKQATFSMWQSKAAMKDFAYGMKEHAEVIKKTRQQKWYSEDMFVRFKVQNIIDRTL
ncbi:spheroidene monooxygenase [Ferruginibacter yonginensis]|uniref:Spheroidene monooxygenase n=1 Tax=Ferruginibacter yonginensis TaxID=1310416 RepID=A0ABV8QP44_9BACT